MCIHCTKEIESKGILYYQGSTLHISGIDLLDGTPVVDIKPFIPDYDTPSSYGDQPDLHSTSVSTNSMLQESQLIVSDGNQPATTSVSTSDQPDSHTTSVSTNSVSQESQLCMSDGKLTDDQCFMGERSECEDDKAVKQWDCDEGEQAPDLNTNSDVQTNQTCLSPTDKNDYCVQNCTECVRNTESSHSAHVNSDTPTKDTDLALQSAHLGMDKQSKLQLAGWIQQPPAPSLSVRFTDHAKEQLAEFSAISQDRNYRFRYLNDTDEARNAICSILREDPRSVYRRNHCRDSLYYFAVDALHATCWFDENFVEVVRIRPVALVDHCKEKYHT